jgi:hypothetical protein
MIIIIIITIITIIIISIIAIIIINATAECLVLGQDCGVAVDPSTSPILRRR